MLFLVFVLGPCEPLIPLLMVPASAHSWTGVALVAAVFALVTIVTMVMVVLFALSGLRAVSIKPLERFSHALAGGAVAMCGLAMVFLGL